MALFALVLPAYALTLSVASEEEVEPGVTVRHYTTTSPTTSTWVAVVDLCTDGVYVDATRAASTVSVTSTWATTNGMTLATNGDFFTGSPAHLYGDAVGGGVRWPAAMSGLSEDLDNLWYYQAYGWIAFTPDGVEFTHTKWVKENTTGLADGWENETVGPEPPAGTLALVSGFPELVVEGTPVTCADPEAATCFADLDDLRRREPRTAMGLSADRGTFFLVVVDGETDVSEGMYGTELADLMQQLGAYEAFNLDGAGASQLWVDGSGTVNDASGNNGGVGTRLVLNQWGVYAGGDDGLPDRPGHCATAPACAILPANGGIVDDASACFRTFGGEDGWETAEKGNDRLLHWTDAVQAEAPDHFAAFQLDFEEAGTYEVQTSSDVEYSVFGAVSYTVHASGADNVVVVDPVGEDGWVDVGTFEFAAGGGQWVTIADATADAVGADQHIVADAIRLTRVYPPDTGDPAADPGAGVHELPGDAGCACSAAGGGGAGMWSLVLLGIGVARRRAAGRQGPGRGVG